jgi:hypothetical protein
MFFIHQQWQRYLTLMQSSLASSVWRELDIHHILLQYGSRTSITLLEDEIHMRSKSTACCTSELLILCDNNGFSPTNQGCDIWPLFDFQKEKQKGIHLLHTSICREPISRSTPEFMKKIENGVRN